VFAWATSFRGRWTDCSLASIGSTRVATHAGPIPNATPVNSEITSANISTSTEGDALIGTLAKPANVGNAKWRIKRVPANAIARPVAPPNNESKMLSVRGCLKIREGCAPSAMLNDTCLRRSIPRTSTRLATLARTISNTNPETIMSMPSQCSYCSRMPVSPRRRSSGIAFIQEISRDRWRSSHCSASAATA